MRLCCPFHADKSPSLQVYYKTHTCYCFSSNCKTHGKSLDVIDFIRYKENISKHEAILKAAEIINYFEGKVQHHQKPIETINEAAQLTMPREQFLQNMFTYFKNAVHNSKPAQEYLQSRGLDETKLEVGYNTAQFHHGNRKDEALINSCVQVGLLTPWGTNTREGGQAYKPFAKLCIVFALRNRTNQVTGLYFRSTINNDESKHFYLKDSEGLYPKYPDADTEKLIITEAVIDAASLLQIKAITEEYSLLSAYGTNRLNDEMKAAITELKQLKEVVFAFDNDEAGNKAALKYAEELKALLPAVTINKIELPCKDVNETLRAYNEEVFTVLLKERTEVLPPAPEGEQQQEAKLFLSTESSIEKKKPEPDNQLNTSNPHRN